MAEGGTMAEPDAEMNEAAKNLKRINDIKIKYEGELLKKANVVAVGIGMPIRNGQIAGELGIMVSVTHKVEATKLAAQDLVPRELDKVRVWVMEIGLPRAGNDTKPERD
jgi:hypothetical protein